jgi:hypothetical protein
MVLIVEEGWQQRKNGRRERGEDSVPLFATILLMFVFNLCLKFNLLLNKHRTLELLMKKVNHAKRATLISDVAFILKRMEECWRSMEHCEVVPYIRV